jgi:hypothetical protein
MPNKRNKLYIILVIALVTGYFWLFTGFYANYFEKDNAAEVCLIKHVTNVPCPSCGSSRSVVTLMHGDLLGSVYLNPFGLIIALIMTITPFWLAYDLITGKSTLLHFYHRTEKCLRKPAVAIPLITLVLMNWIWNITKGL